MIGVDTTALIDLFKNDEKVTALFSNIDEEIVLNDVSYAELMFGIDPANLKHKDEEKFYDELCLNFKVLPLTMVSSKKASEIFWNLKKKGIDIGKFDSMIAGILLSNKVDKIITKNIKHFKDIKGLKIISY